MSLVLPRLRKTVPASRSYRYLLALRRQGGFASYHSYQHAPPPPPFSQAEDAILSASLNHVPAHGFSNMTLTLGARDAGYLDISVNLFPRGPFHLAYYHLVMERLNLHKRVGFGPGKDAESGGQQMGVGPKIRALCVERLKANEKVLSRWQEAMAIMAMPPNVPTSIAELANLSDEMWFLAGDTSVDTSWYTKRATLAAVYASTEMFMTQDQSHRLSDTWEFLDRRLRDVSSVGKLTSFIGQYIGYKAQAVVDVLRSKSIIR